MSSFDNIIKMGSNKPLFILVLCLFVLTALEAASIGGQELSSGLREMLPQIQTTILKGRQNIWKEIEPDGPYWNFPPWLGTFFLSEYYFELKALNISGDLPAGFQSKFDVGFFRSKLLREQQADGSWKQLVDLNQKEGLLDATIFNYWFLKDIGEPIDSQPMKKAKKFILDHGGIEQAQIMTKYKLAAFGVYEWVLLPYIPLFIFKNYFPFSIIYIKDYVAQWVYPHLTGLAYLRYHKTVFPVSRVCLQELRTSRSDHCEEYRNDNPGLSAFKKLSADGSVDNLLEEAIKLRGPRGAYGAYTISTLLNLLSFKDYTLRYSHQSDFAHFYMQNLQTSLNFVQEMYFNRRVPYEGSLDDGRYWDTILAALGLLESGEDPAKVTPTIQYMVNTAVQPNGGIPYGMQFQYAPDIDDTSMLLLLYGKMIRGKVQPVDSAISYDREINRTYTWLKSTQNSDGGFPAFDKDKNDDQYKLIKYIFKLTRIDRSAQIFDPSCADIVGHLFEAMGQSGIVDEELFTKAVSFLYETRQDGMWSARWGINYVYAVGAVLPGLAKIGYDLSQPWILNVMQRLLSVQQADGGFGETSQSYNVKQYLEGVSTASMTAWGLLAMLQVAHLPIPNIQPAITRATEYLLNNFKENGGKFFDRSVVGTGHRGLLNLQYPVYAFSFPLVALSRLNRLCDGKYNPQANPALTERINKLSGIAESQSRLSEQL